MNTRQRLVVFIGLVTIALMLIFPPMKDAGGLYNSIGCQNTGYGFLFNSRSTYIAALDSHSLHPVPAEAGYYRVNNGWCYWSIDQEILKYQIVIASMLTIGIALLLGRRRHLASQSD